METYLAHHGILGMKWGIRRYQNEDGTLTEAGKKRYMRNKQRIKDAPRKTVTGAAVSGMGVGLAKSSYQAGAANLDFWDTAEVSLIKGEARVEKLLGQAAIKAGAATVLNPHYLESGKLAVEAAMYTLGAMDPTMLALTIGGATLATGGAVAGIRAIKRANSARKQNKKFDEYAKVSSK